MTPSEDARSSTGAWYTPEHLVDRLVGAALDGFRSPAGTVRIVDPACGDGRLLAAAAERLSRAGHRVKLVGCEIDPAAAEVARSRLGPGATVTVGDALDHDWVPASFDLVIGNPPFSSPLTRRGPSTPEPPQGSPYADLATGFWDLALRLARADSGRVALVLPQSVLGSRDAEPVRRTIERTSRLVWSWWGEEPSFDARVTVCAVVLERSPSPQPIDWTRVVVDRLGLPEVPTALSTSGTIGERVEARANFRDEYYGLVDAVTDGGDGPPLVTSGLIDPAVCHWGQRPTRFARQRFDAPTVDLDRLSPRFRSWAERTLQPKVLVASQTRVIEAVADHQGLWVPGVPVVRLMPQAGCTLDEVAAVLTSPVATRLLWAASAGTGLSPKALRVGVRTLTALPWPAGPLDNAVEALRNGDVAACGLLVDRAFGLDGNDELSAWWRQELPTARR